MIGYSKSRPKIGLLSLEVEAAVKRDEEDYKNRVSTWMHSLEEWRSNVSLAKALLGGEVKAKLDALEKIRPFSEISNLGSSLSVCECTDGMLEATLNVHGKEIVPDKAKSLLKSGKISVKSMPKGQFNEIYQDYVCSCVLRIANEIFSVILDDLVIVTAVDELLNPKTGHLEEVPILSAMISRRTMSGLKLDAIDPSDSMDNFIHNMSFQKTKGFNRVERVRGDSLILRDD